MIYDSLVVEIILNGNDKSSRSLGFGLWVDGGASLRVVAPCCSIPPKVFKVQISSKILLNHVKTVNLPVIFGSLFLRN